MKKTVLFLLMLAVAGFCWGQEKPVVDGDVLIWVGTKKARMLDVCFLVIGDDTCKEIHFGVKYTRPYNSEGASVSSIEYYPVSYLAKDVAIKKAESMKYMSNEDFEAGRPLKDHAYFAIDNTFLSIGNKERLAMLERMSQCHGNGVMVQQKSIRNPE